MSDSVAARVERLEAENLRLRNAVNDYATDPLGTRPATMRDVANALAALQASAAIFDNAVTSLRQVIGSNLTETQMAAIAKALLNDALSTPRTREAIARAKDLNPESGSVNSKRPRRKGRR